MRAVVTAGGTSEPIDDVRVITNKSTGRFGAACANALAERGVEVVLIASRALATHPDWIHPGVSLIPFDGFASLDQALTDTLQNPIDLLFMAAAVSDYSPAPTTGKIRSTAETLTLTLTRNPKLIGTLRARCGDQTTLVGFKLLSGVPRSTLIDVARGLIRDNDLDFCFANDIRDIRDGQHPGTIVSASEAQHVTGTKAEAAEQLVNEALNHTRPSADRAPPPGFTPVVVPGPPLPVRELVEVRQGFIKPTLPARHARPAMAQSLAVAAFEGTYAGSGFSVLTDDGAAILGLSRLGQTAARQRPALVTAFDEAAASLGEPGPLRPLWPVIVGDRLVGLAAQIGDDVVLPWFGMRHRRRGWGDDLARGLDEAGLAVAAPPDGPVRDWFLERGFVPREGTLPGCAVLTRLDPPSSQAERRLAASVSLVDPARRRILIGQRLVGPWPGYWAFPGGTQEGGETLVQTAVRELAEETGITVTTEPVAERDVIVGHSPGYRVRNYSFVVWDDPDPSPSDEFDARWMDFDEALALRPMAAGTRRILREVTSRLHAQVRTTTVFECLR